MDSRFRSISLGCLALGVLIAQAASAQTCGTATCTAEEFCYQGDGYLVDSAECILFEAPLMLALLSNLGGFSLGDHVHVEGCAEPLGFSICMVSGFSIRDNTIESADPQPEVPALGFSGRAFAILLVAGTALWLGKGFR